VLAHENLQEVIGRAIIDPAFRQALLECPALAVREFSLTAEELAFLAGVRARSFEQFAAKVDRWIARAEERKGRRRPRAPRPVATPVR